MAARTSSPKATRVWPPHTFTARENGPKDYRGDPIECEVCPFPSGNAVHKAAALKPADLPPTPEEDVSDRILGEDE